MYQNVEIRKLPAELLCNVVNILETNNDWKKLMSQIPKDLQSSSFEPKYNNEHIRLIEDYAKESNMKCAEILFDEWGTSGKIRPTLNDLKNIILKTQIYRAADEIALILNEPKPARPMEGPAAPISTNVTDMLNETCDSMDSTSMQKFCNRPTAEMKSASNLIEFSKTLHMESDNQSSFGNKTTNKIASDSNLIKFSKDNNSPVSMNIPNLTTMISASETNAEINSFPTTNTVQDNETPYYPSVYQQSFPNIDVSSGIDSAILQDTKLKHFAYEELQNITNNFSENVINGVNGPIGRIGSGGFGDVFVGYHQSYGVLAVKKVHDHLVLCRKPDIAMKVFNAEVKFLSQFRHKNILPIIGFSKDGPMPCIVCEYIEGGSLMERIAAKVLSDFTQRINILVGTAEGLKYLHSSEPQVEGNQELLDLGIGAEFDSENSSKNFVHGDVKTANILLTKDCIPKLCDFGLAKQYDATIITSCPMGTSAYMAPEGLHGTITQKIDVFSYGIVVLEILTGLKPIVVNGGEKINIKDYIEDNINGDITSMLDSSVSNWNNGKGLYDLALKCLERDRKKRPSMNDVCNILYGLNK